MSSRRPMKPGDPPVVSEEQRAQWEMEIRAGRQPSVDQPPSKSRLGRILDALERIVAAGSQRPYR